MNEDLTVETNDDNQDESKRKPNAFAVMNNVRDHCQQPVSKKLLMLTLATYANADGICYPSNATLAKATGISKRTVQRILPALAAEGELEILTPGKGRDQRRIISLKRYTAKHDTAMTCLNAPRSLGKAGCNNHREQPVPKKNTLKVRSTHGPQTTDSVFYLSKSAQKNGKNRLQDNSGILEKGKRGAKIPIAQRNKIIARLNVRKVAIYRDASYTPEERQHAIDKVNHALQKL